MDMTIVAISVVVVVAVGCGGGDGGGATTQAGGGTGTGTMGQTSSVGDFKSSIENLIADVHKNRSFRGGSLKLRKMRGGAGGAKLTLRQRRAQMGGRRTGGWRAGGVVVVEVVREGVG